jgi:uncharacterized membrane protein YfcA
MCSLYPAPSAFRQLWQRHKARQLREQKPFLSRIRLRMAQYKAAMARLYGAEDVPREPTAVTGTPKPVGPSGPLEAYVEENFNFLMKFLIPLLWCFCFVILMDHDSFINNLYITFIGIFAAILANAVPIGGGIVYVPSLALLGVNLHLGVAFSVSTMTFGNGVFGFLKWMHKDPSLIVWESFAYTVLPSSAGTLLAMVYFPPMDVALVRTMFAVFCLLLAGLVILAVYRGGAIDKVIDTPLEGSIITTCAPRAGAVDVDEEVAEKATLVTEDAEVSAVPEASAQVPTTTVLHAAFHTHRNQTVSGTSWVVIGVVSFLAGAVLVPNIGVGPALTTFLALQIVGYAPKRAIVTGIVTGGWVCVVPFLLHLLWLEDVPLQLWIMVLPGVYVGSQVSLALTVMILFVHPNVCYSIVSTVLMHCIVLDRWRRWYTTTLASLRC